jgi:hypothetical protein
MGKSMPTPGSNLLPKEQYCKKVIGINPSRMFWHWVMHNFNIFLLSHNVSQFQMSIMFDNHMSMEKDTKNNWGISSECLHIVEKVSLPVSAVERLNMRRKRNERAKSDTH